MLIIVCIISVTVDIMLLVMSTEHVILAEIGPGVLLLVKKVKIAFYFILALYIITV